VPTLYAYIDESGDEGFPKFAPHTDLLAYRDRSNNLNGPSPFFMMCGAIVLDTDRAAFQAHVRALSRVLYPAVADQEVHWRKLDWEKKQHAAETCAALDFTWIAVVAYKPALPKKYATPYLYNWCTRLLLERLCLDADARACSLIPVFSSRSRTNYTKLQQYVTAEMTAFGKAAVMKPIRTQQPNKERLLQLVDVCAGSLHNALEVNSFGKLQPAFFKATAPRMARSRSGKVWASGLKFFPDAKGTDFGLATAWIDKARKR
jgi:hypothetical protein